MQQPELNPAKVICYGEVLFDILPNASLPGGAPMNVAYHLNKLGNSAQMITRIGNDNLGKQLLQVFEKNLLAKDHVQIDEDHKTGVVYATPDEKGEMIYEIVQPVAWDYIEIPHDADALVKEADFLVFGSLSSREQKSRETLNKLLEKKIRKVLDINLRKPFISQEHIEHLLWKADILKLNVDELNLISSWFGTSKQDEEKIEVLHNKFQIALIIVTYGKDGAIVSNGLQMHRHEGFKVNVADTIGAGDSFLAGFIDQLHKGKKIDEALAFGCAVGAVVASLPGGCPPYQIADVKKLIKEKTDYKEMLP